MKSQDKHHTCSGGHGCCFEPSSGLYMHTHCCALGVRSTCDAVVSSGPEGPPAKLVCCVLQTGDFLDVAIF